MKSIRQVAEAINQALESGEFEDFHERRARRLNRKVHRGPLFETFSTDAEDDFTGWAIHYGGRAEMQFNLGMEQNRLFRYGLAFSLDASRSLPDPAETLRPLIDRFNELIESAELPDGALMWWFEEGRRSKEVRPGVIPSALVRNRVFIFIGFSEALGPKGADSGTIQRAAKGLASLLPLYNAVHSGEETTRVARMCWNSRLWQQPSGAKAKSSDENSFEAENGFGHEEWNFATSNLRDGWKYGFLQAFNGRNSNYLGRNLTLLLYAIDGETKARYWVGRIRNAQVLTEDAAGVAKKWAEKSGLLASMRRDVTSLGLSDKTLKEAQPFDLFNVRYQLTDLEVFDSPIQFDASTLGTPRYGIIQAVPSSQMGVVEGGAAAEEVAARNIKALTSLRKAYVVERVVDLVHKQWQLRWRAELPEKLKGCDVRIEQPLGGFSIDLLVSRGGHHIIFELKTAPSVRQAIREALSQLLEYAYWPPGNKNVDALVIVGAGKAGPSDEAYIRYLSDRHKLPLFYLHCDKGRIEGIEAFVERIFSERILRSL